MHLTDERISRIHDVVRRRQYNLTLILENVHDPHNIGAILRTCDSVGISEIYVIYTEERLKKRGVEVGKTSASGTRKWIDIHYFEDVKECLSLVKERYRRIFGTVIRRESKSLYSIDLSGSCALIFGNEKDGISQKAAAFVDDNFVIPQYGFVKSLNISVACAISLYECLRQRQLKGAYEKAFDNDLRNITLFESYVARHKKRP